MASVSNATKALALTLTAVGCSSHPDTYQGYVEGEFVYMASSQPGRLEHLAVTRGQQVAQGAPLFTLEAIEETAAQVKQSGVDAVIIGNAA